MDSSWNLYSSITAGGLILPKVEGNLVSINESERTFTLQYTAEEDDKKF